MSSETRNGLSYSEAGKLGGIKSVEISKKLKQERINQYLENPSNCKECLEILDYKKRHYSYCSRSCSVKFNNKGRRRHGHEPLNCVICSRKTTGSSRKYCSKECYLLDRNDKLEKELLEGNVSSPRRLREFLIESRGYKCEICSNMEWMNKPIPIELDHVDGNSENNLPDNLRLICCNCHAQTPTYKAKNVGNGRAKRRQRYRDGKSY